MGYGLCAGIVASLVRGKTGRAVVVAGDGGIQHFGSSYWSCSWYAGTVQREGEPQSNCWWFRNPANQLRLVVYLSVYRVLYIPSGAGFLPSTVRIHPTWCIWGIKRILDMVSSFFGFRPGLLSINFFFLEGWRDASNSGWPSMSWELPNTSLKSPIRITVSWLAKVSVGIGSRTGMIGGVEVWFSIWSLLRFSMFLRSIHAGLHQLPSLLVGLARQYKHAIGHSQDLGKLIQTSNLDMYCMNFTGVPSTLPQ